MTNRTTGQRISVGVDGSAESRAALRWCVEHARAGDSITLVHVWRASPAMVDAGLCDPEDDTAAASLAHRELIRARELLRDPNITLRTEVVHGEPRQQLCELDTDLLVLGRDSHTGIVGRVFGSVIDHVARHARFATVIVPPPLDH